MERIRAADIGKLALTLAVMVAVQAIFTSRVNVLGVTADLFLILVVLVAISRGSFAGAIFGFCAGLVADLVFLDPLGLRTFIYLMSGWVVGRYCERFGMRNPWMVIVLTAVVSLTALVVYGFFRFAMTPGGGFFTLFRIQILPAAVVNGLLAAPIYLGLIRLGVLPVTESGRLPYR